MSVTFDGVSSDRVPWKRGESQGAEPEQQQQQHQADETHAHEKRKTDRQRLHDLAKIEMETCKFIVDYTAEIAEQVTEITSKDVVAEALKDGVTQDLRDVLFMSIDNDDTLDIDQLQTAYFLPDGSVMARIAVADVATSVPKQSPIDQRAKDNTATIYTPAFVNSMIPEELSHGLTSLNEHTDRIAMVVEFVIQGLDFTQSVDTLVANFEKGSVVDERVMLAVVNNKAKLAYPSVGAWLEGTAPPPACVKDRQDVLDSLILQDKISQVLLSMRRRNGALEFRRSEYWVVFDGDRVTGMVEATSNRATGLIENFMVQANGIVSRYLSSLNKPTIQRVVEDPEKWDAIVAFAKTFQFTLPETPDNVELRRFLALRQQEDPEGFSDLSLTVIKLMGRGKYLFAPVGSQGGHAHGHFGLAVHDYTHSTAPNRRFPDLATQRIVHSVIRNQPFPYTDDELMEIADHCSEMEDSASKIERKSRKSAAAILLRPHIGEEFDGIITASADKGVWVRIENPPVEGKVVKAKSSDVSVAQHVRVRLTFVHIDKALIDFELAGPEGEAAKAKDKTDKSRDKDDHGHGHSHTIPPDAGFGHGHSHGGVACHGHSHAESHGHSHAESHGHGHAESHGHSHAEGHGHSHAESHGHSHAEGHGHSHAGHGHSHARR